MESASQVIAALALCVIAVCLFTITLYVGSFTIWMKDGPPANIMSLSGMHEAVRGACAP